MVFEPDETVLLDGAAELRDRLVPEPGVDPRPAVEEVGVFLDEPRDGAVVFPARLDRGADLADEGDALDAQRLGLPADHRGPLGPRLGRRDVGRPEVEVTVDHAPGLSRCPR